MLTLLHCVLLGLFIIIVAAVEVLPVLNPLQTPVMKESCCPNELTCSILAK